MPIPCNCSWAVASTRGGIIPFAPKWLFPGGQLGVESPYPGGEKCVRAPSCAVNSSLRLSCTWTHHSIPWDSPVHTCVPTLMHTPAWARRTSTSHSSLALVPSIPGAPCLGAKANHQHLERSHIAQGKEPGQFSPRLFGSSRSFPGLAQDDVPAEGHKCHSELWAEQVSAVLWAAALLSTEFWHFGKVINWV